MYRVIKENSTFFWKERTKPESVKSMSKRTIIMRISEQKSDKYCEQVKNKIKINHFLHW